MGYDALLKRQVDAAFAALGDLVKDVQLLNRTAVKFDFATNQPDFSADDSKTVKGIMLEKTPNKKSNKVGDSLSSGVHQELLLKTKDIEAPDLYDTAIIEGITWRFVPPYTDNGYTTTVTLVRGS